MSERDFPEEWIQYNGQYTHVCLACKQGFIGHKRRWICKVCSSDAARAAEEGQYEKLLNEALDLNQKKLDDTLTVNQGLVKSLNKCAARFQQIIYSLSNISANDAIKKAELVNYVKHCLAETLIIIEQAPLTPNSYGDDMKYRKKTSSD